MPFDAETLDGKNDEFTFINNSYPDMAINRENYIPLDERQLCLCSKMGATYYCKNSYVLRHRSEHTCELAVYYHTDPKTIIKHCRAMFASRQNFPPKFWMLVRQWFSLTYPDHGFWYVETIRDPEKSKLPLTKF